MKGPIDVAWARTLPELTKQVLQSRKLKENLNGYMKRCFPKAPPDFTKCMVELCEEKKGLAERISTLLFRESAEIVGFVQIVWNSKDRSCLLMNLCRVRGRKGLCLPILQTAIRMCNVIHPTAVRALLHVGLAQAKSKLQMLYESYGWKVANVERDKLEYEWLLRGRGDEFIS